jgi:hypothetical protein
MKAQSGGGLLTTVFNDALAPPQSDVGFRPTPARGRVGRDCEQIIFDTSETLGSRARVIPSLDPMSAKVPVAHVSSPPTSEPELIFMVLKPARINASITCAGVDGPSPRTDSAPPPAPRAGPFFEIGTYARRLGIPPNGVEPWFGSALRADARGCDGGVRKELAARVTISTGPWRASCCAIAS